MLGRVGLGLLLAIVGLALAAPVLAPFDPAAQDIALRLLPPLSRAGDGLHLLGTDALGRDLASRLLLAGRISLLVGAGAVLGSGAIGVFLGLVAGSYDRLGRAVLAVSDIQLAVPFLVLALAAVAVLGPGLLNLTIVLAATNWVQYARVVRAEALVLREADFIAAARAVGATPLRVMLRHLLPNVMPTVIVLSSLQIARMILLEASLSYLGLGIPPELPSWGGMVADGRAYMARAWWVATIPGLAIFATAIAFNLAGERLRDLLDPRQRSGAR